MSQTRAALAPPTVLRPQLPLGVIVAMACLAQFMVVLDSTIVTVALPDMRTELGLSTNQQQWVVSGYLITLGGFLLLAARAGDLLGRKRVFLFGAAVFTAASLAGGLASSPTTLLVARIVQGVGAAALAPSSLSLITASHTDEHRRHRALALWSIMGGAAGAVGVVLGGVLTAGLSWRWVLFVNLPLGVGLLVAGILTPLPSSAGAERTGLDVPGALSATLGIGALTYGLSQASSDGWGSRGVVTALVVAAVLIAGFVAVEATSSRPLIPLALFRPRALRIGNLAMLSLGVTMTSASFFISLYLQQALGYSALRTGLALLPLTIVLVVGGLASRRLVPLVGARNLLVAGGLITAGGVAWLAGTPAHPAYLSHLLGPSLVAGAGISLMLLPITLAATTGVDPRDAGAASGLVNTARQLGGAIGLAVLVTVAATATTHAAGHSTRLVALVHGYHVAFLVNAAVLVLAALAALALPAEARARRRQSLR
ncbi:MFS transporter [Rugosimonospora acidiphila]|uniref:MFS transporter n=1 Tax=Rugosimonospora acidiphila TaxID=556531 RepID=A0ABP9S2G2_9ACTN